MSKQQAHQALWCGGELNPSGTAKMNMIIHDGGHTNVVTSDGLLSPSDLRAKKNNIIKEKYFDYIITTPLFGSTIKQTKIA